MTQSKLIMFDFDGVIADSLDEQRRACVGTLRARGLHDLATRAQFLDCCGGGPLRALGEHREAAVAGVPAIAVRP